MADKITWANKESLVTDPTILEKNKVTDSNMNEIKSVTNNNADELDELIVEGEENITENTRAVIKEGVIRHFTEISNTYGTSESIGYSQKYQNEHNVIVSADTPTSSERVWFKKSKNLLPKKGTQIISGITITEQTDGSLILNGTASTNVSYYYCGNDTTYESLYTINKGGKYTLSSTIATGYFIYIMSGGSVIASLTNGGETTFTATANATYRIFIRVSTGVSLSNIHIYPQLEEGTTATTYEPYVEYKSIQVDNKTFTEAVSVGTEGNNSRVWFKKSKNLFIPTLTNNGTNINVNAATVSLNADEYSFICSGSDMYFGQVKNSGEDYSYNCGTLYKVTPGETIKVLVTGTGFNSIFITKYTNSKVSLGFENIASNTASLVIPENCYYVTIRFGVRSATSGTTYTTKVMLAKTTDTLTYEPYIKPSINVDGETIYTKTDDEWELLTLTSEFKNYNNNISFRPKIKKEGNVVTIKGIISPTADITNTSTEHIMFVIPEKYRPTDMPLHQVCQASGMNKWLLIVAVGGNVTLSRYGTTEMTTAPASSWLPFTITYLV